MTLCEGGGLQSEEQALQASKQVLERVEVARRAGAAPSRERGTCIKKKEDKRKEEDKKRVSFKEAVYIVCFQ